MSHFLASSEVQVAPIEVKLSKQLAVGEMTEEVISPGSSKKILFCRTSQGYRAVGNKCSHYAAPLVKGALTDTTIRCQWHGATFRLEDGQIEDSPGCDSIHSYTVEERNGEVVALVPKYTAEMWRRPHILSQSPALGYTKDQHMVIVGGGCASLSCAETLRSLGFEGAVTVIGEEKNLPYDRPKLSKASGAKIKDILLKSKDYLDARGISYRAGVAVDRIDVEANEVIIGEERVSYTKVFVGTGGRLRRLPIEGIDMKGILGLRTVEDAAMIHEECVGRDVVIMGSSFIGMEMASALIRKASTISVIGMETVPFERVLGVEIGTFIADLFEGKGVRLYMQQCVTKFISESGDDTLTHVQLKDGTVLPAQLCISGVGCVPNTEVLEGNPGIEIARDRGVQVDETLKAARDVYAGGDIARYTYHVTKDSVRIEHWGMAQIHGRIAAYNMLGIHKPLQSIPFFWTQVFGMSIRYAGHALRVTQTYIVGTPSTKKFVAYLCHEDEVHAVVSVGRDPEAAIAANLFERGQMPSLSTLQSHGEDVSLAQFVVH